MQQQTQASLNKVLHWLRSLAKQKGVSGFERMSVRDLYRRVFGEPCSAKRAWVKAAKRYMESKGQAYVPPPAKPLRVKAPKQSSQDFYVSDAWRAARYQALLLGNGCCSLCGRSRRGHGVVIHVDHIKPRSRFPDLALTVTNLQLLCEDCNLGKSNKDTTDWR